MGYNLIYCSTVGFDSGGAAAWRTLNFAFQKSLEVFDYVRGNAEKTYDSCMSLCLNGVAVCVPCLVPSIIGTIVGHIAFAVKLSMDISVQLYAEIVGLLDGNAVAERDLAVHENVMTIHGNIITTHTAVSQILTIVAGIKPQTDLIKARRRMQVVVDCVNTTVGFAGDCRKPSCENPTLFCDGTFNHEYISQLKGGENHKSRTMGYLCIQ